MIRNAFAAIVAGFVMVTTLSGAHAQQSLKLGIGVTSDFLAAYMALDQGLFRDQIVPVELKTRKGVEQFALDEHVRKGATIADMQKLKAVFKKDGTVTAANSSSISDGAAALVLLSAASVFAQAAPASTLVTATKPATAPRKTVETPAAAASSRTSGVDKERVTARVVGEFRGWSGGTYFPLDNGQVWRQVGAESNELPPRRDAVVEIYPSGNGYWRLRFEGAWITVRRLQ